MVSTTVLFSLRALSGSEAIQWSAWYWDARFLSTTQTRKAQFRVYYDVLDIFNEVLTMAGKRSKNADTERPRTFQSMEWVNVNLTAEDVAQIEVWLSEEPDVLGELCRLVAEGYGIAIKPESRGGGFMATATYASTVVGDVGRGLSAFAATPYEAAACLLYKLVIKLDGNLSSAAAGTSSRFR